MIRYQRQFLGPVEAVIMDLAGTCVDHGSLAPILAFYRLFKARGIEVTEAETRAPMGLEKREHIRQMLGMERIQKVWVTLTGEAPADEDIDALYKAFLPIQQEMIRSRTQLIDGVQILQEFCAHSNIRIGVNTGYSRDMAEALLPAMADQGFVPHSSVCATEVPGGRPMPHMSLKNAIELEVTDVRACIKVDDTRTGIEEGLSAGMWTVAVAVTGNALGLDKPEWLKLSADQQQLRAGQARTDMVRSGAHYVVDSIAEMPQIITEINRRMMAGEAP